MDDYQIKCEMLGTCQRCREHYEKVRKEIEYVNFNFDIIIKTEDIEFDMGDVLSEDEQKALITLMDSLIFGEINRLKTQETKLWEELKRGE